MVIEFDSFKLFISRIVLKYCIARSINVQSKAFPTNCTGPPLFPLILLIVLVKVNKMNYLMVHFMNFVVDMASYLTGFKRLAYVKGGRRCKLPSKHTQWLRRKFPISKSLSTIPTYSVVFNKGFLYSVYESFTYLKTRACFSLSDNGKKR